MKNVEIRSWSENAVDVTHVRVHIGVSRTQPFVLGMAVVQRGVFRGQEEMRVVQEERRDPLCA
jgi:hypothetical protein